MRYRERYPERRERALRRVIGALLATTCALGINSIVLMGKIKAAEDEKRLEADKQPEPISFRLIRDEPEPTPPADEPEYILPDYIPDWDELKRLAKMVYGEARGVESQTEQAAVIWCVLNRIDAGYGDTITEVVNSAQFRGYRPDNPMVDDFGRDLEELAADVVSRWLCEKLGEEDVGRVLPPDYLWFTGHAGRNVFRNAFRGGETWDWSLPSPYES